MDRRRLQQQINSIPQADLDFLPFGGGLDTETPGWEVPPGHLRDSLNYEIGVNGRGYSDVVGYERFDGESAPSDASYAILNITAPGTIVVGNTITGATSGATALVALIDLTGTPKFLVITKVVGTFVALENLLIAATPQAVAASAAMVDAAATLKLAAIYRNAAADRYRALIDPVPGETTDPVSGVFQLHGIKYAWRNAVGGLTAAMYKATTSGWSLVSLGREVGFTSGGAYEILEGDTITGATSAATAVVGRVILVSGSWASGTAVGRLILVSQSGTLQAENLNVGANTNVATIAANSAAVTMLPDGRFEVWKDNFGGQLGTLRAYGCDGVNHGWEFDGTVFVKINTGMTDDAPTHVVVHKNQLFFSFASSAQHSGIGDPYTFDLIFGAGEIATGDDITGFTIEPGSEGDATLAIYTKNRVTILYGSSPLDWNPVRYRAEIGSRPYTQAQLAYTLFFGDRGITTLRTAQEFGNFQDATVSTKVQNFINSHRSRAVAACIARDKNQYRVFFDDTFALYVTMSGRKIAGLMPVQLAHTINCMASDENSEGAEEIYFGATDGYVYQMEKGTSFDGQAIDAYQTTHFHFLKSLGWEKAFHSAVLEAKGTGYAEFDFTFELGYGDEAIAQPGTQTKELALTVGRWDAPGALWDRGFWDGRGLQPASLDLEGVAENISFTIRKSSDYMTPVTFTGVRTRYNRLSQVR